MSDHNELHRYNLSLSVSELQQIREALYTLSSVRQRVGAAPSSGRPGGKINCSHIELADRIDERTKQRFPKGPFKFAERDFYERGDGATTLIPWPYFELHEIKVGDYLRCDNRHWRINWAQPFPNRSHPHLKLWLEAV